MSYRTVISSLTAIPAQWSIRALSEAVTMKSGEGITSANIQELGTYPVFGGNGMRGYCEAFNRDGDCSLIGRQGALCGAVHHTTGKIFASEHAIVCKALGETSQLFITYVLHALDLNELSEASAQPGLSVEKLRKLSILLPDDPQEQEAIAKALSDADALIEGLERLIAKKRLIKQGAMQDLLTAKRRLPGFSGEWVERKLGTVAMLQRGFDLPNSVRADGDYPVVYSNGIMASHKTFKCEGPGVVTGRSGTIGNVTYVQGRYWPHNTALWVKNFFGNDSRFIFYLLQFVDLRRFASGSGVPTLNRNDAHDDPVRIPVDIPEQLAISAVLDDMDAEIQALDTRLEKARQVKEGMMQNLLTGRIRLV